MKTPLRHVFVTCRHLHVHRDDRVETDLLNAIGGEIDTRAVLRLVGVAGGVDEVAGLRLVVPLGARTGDALLIALVENDAAFGDDSVFCVEDRYLVGLQTVRADTDVNVSFVNDNARVFRSGRVLFGRVNADSIGGRALRAVLRRLPSRRRLIRREWIYVRRVGEWIGYLPIDRIGLLRKYKLAGQDKDQVCQQKTQKRVESSETRLVSPSA